MAKINTKRYDLSRMKDGKYDFVCKQFPAMGKADSLVQGARHAKALGWTEYHVSYIGKWIEDTDPNTYEIYKED